MISANEKTWWQEPTGICPQHLSAEKAQDKLVEEWAKTLPEDERRIVEGLPKLGGDSHAVGRDHDATEMPEASETVDFAGRIDQAHEEIMELFDLDEAQARDVMAWAVEREGNAARTMQAKVLGRILGRFLGSNTHDANVVFWALAFQSGVARQLTRHNANSKSKELGVSRALMSRWQKIWEDELGLYDLTYAKTDEAREKYRRARNAYVQRQKEAVA